MFSVSNVLSNSVRADRFPKPNEKRIYFLIKDSEIVYVGQSHEPSLRFNEHRSNGKDFDFVSVFNVSSPAMINEIEADLIAKLNPKLNLRMHANKWIRKCDNQDPYSCFSRSTKKRKFCKERMENFYIDAVVSHKYEVSPCEYALYDKDGNEYHVSPKHVMEKTNANSEQK